MRRLVFALVVLLAALLAAAGFKTLWPAGSEYVYAGVPRVDDWATRLTTHNLVNPGFALSYSERLSAPLWVGYVAREIEGGSLPSRPERFSTDARTLRRVSHDDYTSSGFDRGHLAPNFLIAMVYGRQAQLAAFRMSNIVPQAPRHNQLLWQRMEELEANELAARHGEVWVLAGPVYGEEPPRLDSGVPVPEALYRIWLRESDSGRPKVAAFIVPQEVCGFEPLEDYLVTVRDIERRTGLDFFHELPTDVEEPLETRASLEYWPAIREAGTEARFGDRWEDRPCPWR